MLAPRGTDPAGQRLAGALAAAGVADAGVVADDWRTPVKRRLVADGQVLLREDEDGAGPAPAAAVLAALDAAGPQPVLVLCDYGLGALGPDVRAWLVAHRDRFATVALDAHDLRPWTGLSATVVTPSCAEAARLLGQPTPAPDGDRPAAGARWLPDLRRRLGAAVVALTLDRDGSLVAGPDGPPYRTRSTPVPTGHTVGAGDAYLAGLTLAVAAGADIPGAAEVGQAAARSSMRELATCVCDPAAVRAAGTAGPPPGTAPARHPVPLGHLLDSVGAARRDGRRVVFTNGCFDVLHRGHVAYLQQARALGDLLVVAVNDDDGVRRLKGPQRPVNTAGDRMAVLAALACVDLVTPFAADSPTALIEAVRPDVYVKGGDYPPDMIPDAALVRRLGGRVRVLDYVPDRSTTAIISRIRGAHAGAGRPG